MALYSSTVMLTVSSVGGFAVTVVVIVFLVTVYVILVVPTAFAVTFPPLTDATLSFELFHSDVYWYSILPPSAPVSVLLANSVPFRLILVPMLSVALVRSSDTFNVSNNILAAARETCDGSAIVFLSTSR